MNWPRTILDGIIMALLFNAVVGVGFLIYPQAYTTMFPKEIKEAAMLHFLGMLKSVLEAIIPNTKGMPQPMKLFRNQTEPVVNCNWQPRML